ncbi:hypothetical protein ACGF3C_07465 [Micromonospora sp. NPDC047762]|uniref:hypothetical protein n=1 Tax=unclassified Micromonospora TaxID=2617518 RepID=UPI00340DD8B0
MNLTSLIRASKRQFLFGAVMWCIGAPLIFYALFQGMLTLYFMGLATMAVGTGIVARCLRQTAGK